MGVKFLKRYNWLGQKLLAQHQFDDLSRLLEHQQTIRPDLTTATTTITTSLATCSEHLVYLDALMLVKSGQGARQAVMTLQQLDSLERNGHHFLLLCQALLFLGNNDALVAICKQLLGKQVDWLAQRSRPKEREAAQDLINFTELDPGKADDKQTNTSKTVVPSSLGELDQIAAAAAAGAATSGDQSCQLAAEPRVWLLFGLALSARRQFQDAQAALQMASKLGGQAGGMAGHFASGLACASYLARRHGRQRQAQQVLEQTLAALAPARSQQAELLLASLLAATNQERNLVKATAIIANLRAHEASNKNPSEQYNKVARDCDSRRRQLLVAGDWQQDAPGGLQAGWLRQADWNESELNLRLLACHLGLRNAQLAASKQATGADRASMETLAASLVEQARNSGAACWASSSLWCNLAVCQLARSKWVAALACSLKASALRPQDWRSSFNLALASLRVGLVNRALLALLAAKRGYTFCVNQDHQEREEQEAALISLLAVCYERLGQLDESRRLHVVASRSQLARQHQGESALGLLNYASFLQRHEPGEPGQGQDWRQLQWHLLDRLEQAWLRRGQAECQFSGRALALASELAKQSGAKRNFAWSKQLAPADGQTN